MLLAFQVRRPIRQLRTCLSQVGQLVRPRPPSKVIISPALSKALTETRLAFNIGVWIARVWVSFFSFPLTRYRFVTDPSPIISKVPLIAFAESPYLGVVDL